MIVKPSLHGCRLTASAFFEAIDELFEVSTDGMIEASDGGELQPRRIHHMQLSRCIEGVADKERSAGDVLEFAWADVEHVEIRQAQVDVALREAPGREGDVLVRARTISFRAV